MLDGRFASKFTRQIPNTRRSDIKTSAAFVWETNWYRLDREPRLALKIKVYDLYIKRFSNHI